MDVDSANINVAAFLPESKTAPTKDAKKGKKRTIATGDHMQVDEATGIEGTAAGLAAPQQKRKKQNSLELRKIPVPSHRYTARNMR